MSIPALGKGREDVTGSASGAGVGRVQVCGWVGGCFPSLPREKGPQCRAVKSLLPEAHVQHQRLKAGPTWHPLEPSERESAITHQRQPCPNRCRPLQPQPGNHLAWPRGVKRAAPSSSQHCSLAGQQYQLVAAAAAAQSTGPRSGRQRRPSTPLHGPAPDGEEAVPSLGEATSPR